MHNGGCPDLVHRLAISKLDPSFLPQAIVVGHLHAMQLGLSKIEGSALAQCPWPFSGLDFRHHEDAALAE